jgi:hypothetical protein
MGSTGVTSSEHAPSSIEPHRGQVPENDVESSACESWDVLHEDVAWFHVANDARHLGPESRASACESGSGASVGDVLAREASRHHVNTASPRSSVKGANVIPNREGRENAVILSGDKNACGIGVEFNGADGTPSKEAASEYAATSACE